MLHCTYAVLNDLELQHDQYIHKMMKGSAPHHSRRIAVMEVSAHGWADIPMVQKQNE
jgi:hypothetical protein